MFKKNENGPPKDATEKFRLRLLIGRKTGRMDLACKEFWPNGHSQQTSRVVTQPGSPTKQSRRQSSLEGDIESIEENDISNEVNGEVSEEKIEESTPEDLEPLFAEVLSGCNDEREINQENTTPSVSGKMDIEFRLFKIPPELFRFSG